MPLSNEVCESLWRAAAKQEIGIKFRAKLEDFKRVQADLYDWRKARGGFENIEISFPAGGEYIYMLKKTVELD